MVSLDSLRDTALFSGCSDQDLSTVREIARIRNFQDGELLLSFGDEAKELFVISSGTVHLEMPLSVMGHERQIVFQTLGPGDIVGWSSLVPGGHFTLSGRALDRTSVLAFGRDELTGLFEQMPGFGCRVLTNALLVATLRLQRTHRVWTSEIQQNLDRRYR